MSKENLGEYSYNLMVKNNLSFMTVKQRHN